MVRIRLARRGRRHCPFFHVVVADQRIACQKRFIEKIGTYDPLMKTEKREDKVNIKVDRLNYWVERGAQLSDTVKILLKKKV